MARPRKPTQVKIAEGNRGKRKLDPKTEPQFKKEMPTPPDHLDDDARAEWDEMAPLIFEAGVLTKVDGKALACYCEAFATWKGACEAFNDGRRQFLLCDDKGKEFKNPLIGMINDASLRMLRFLTEFGLTPVSRSKVVLKPTEEEDDPFAKFQEERRGMRGKLRQIAGTSKTA